MSSRPELHAGLEQAGVSRALKGMPHSAVNWPIISQTDFPRLDTRALQPDRYGSAYALRSRLRAPRVVDLALSHNARVRGAACARARQPLRAVPVG
jgi:hypothetical protein